MSKRPSRLRRTLLCLAVVLLLAGCGHQHCDPWPGCIEPAGMPLRPVTPEPSP